MRILLDENLPRKLVAALRAGGHAAESVHTLKMQGLDNGRLHEFAMRNFDLCFTRDFGFSHNARHLEFPQFRSKLSAMKKVRQAVAARRSLHGLEKTMARFLPAGLQEELGAIPGRRVRWLPMTLIFWVFLQMVLCPGSSCR